jgi:hypothetical protein
VSLVEKTMSEHYGQMVIRFYAHHDDVECVVQRVDREGFPDGPDLVCARGKTKDDAVEKAMRQTEDHEVQAALRAHLKHETY